MAKNMVTITLEEYKELLLKEKPTDKDRELLKRIVEIVEPHLKYSDYKYDSYRVMEDVKFEDMESVVRDVFTMLKYVDFDKYMTIWNKVMTNHRKEEEEKLRIEQMNKAKDLRKENEENGTN